MTATVALNHTATVFSKGINPFVLNEQHHAGGMSRCLLKQLTKMLALLGLVYNLGRFPSVLGERAGAEVWLSGPVSDWLPCGLKSSTATRSGTIASWNSVRPELGQQQEQDVDCFFNERKALSCRCWMPE